MKLHLLLLHCTNYMAGLYVGYRPMPNRYIYKLRNFFPTWFHIIKSFPPCRIYSTSSPLYPYEGQVWPLGGDTSSLTFAPKQLLSPSRVNTSDPWRAPNTFWAYFAKTSPYLLALADFQQVFFLYKIQFM